MKRSLIGLATLLAISLVVGGCGNSVFEGMENKTSTEAKKFDVAQKLDNGDYDYILANADSVSAIDYAAAAMGKMGYTTTTLVNTLNTVGSSSTSSSVSTATFTASAAGGNSDMSSVLAIPVDPAQLHYLISAQTKLTDELASNPTDQNLNMQAVLVAYVTINGVLAAVATESGVADPTDGLTAAEIDDVGNYFGTSPTNQVDTDGDGAVDTSSVTLISNAVVTIGNSILYAITDTSSSLRKAVVESTSGSGGIGAGDTTVSAAEIQDYLVNQI